MIRKPIIEKPYVLRIVYVKERKVDLAMGYLFGERTANGLVCIFDPQQSLEKVARYAYLAYAQSELETIDGIEKGHFPISRVEYRDAILRGINLGREIYLEGLTYLEFCDFKEMVRNHVRFLEITDNQAEKACVIGERALVQGDIGREMGFEQQIIIRGPLGEHLLNPDF